METNISWLFYKNYFSEIDFLNPKRERNLTSLKTRNNRIINASFYYIPNKLVQQTIETKVQYPGLVTGVGINHEANIEGEFKLGIHFNYTYGMPVIYGSSVKGLLRNAFPEEKEIKTEKQKRLRESKTKLIRKYLGPGFEFFNIDYLRDWIFEGKKRYREEGEEKQQNLSIYHRDIFFDAVIAQANSQKKILAPDSITPHVKSGILKNPIPLTFLKIAPGVKMEFRFDLKDSNIEGITLLKEQKLQLFKKILEDFGIGAKTNVGYGQFSEIK